MLPPWSCLYFQYLWSPPTPVHNHSMQFLARNWIHATTLIWTQQWQNWVFNSLSHEGTTVFLVSLISPYTLTLNSCECHYNDIYYMDWQLFAVRLGNYALLSLEITMFMMHWAWTDMPHTFFQWNRFFKMLKML